MVVKQVSAIRPFKMIYGYLLKNAKHGNLYRGWTPNLKRRYPEHNGFLTIFYVGYDINEEYVRLAEKRIKDFSLEFNTPKLF